MSMTMMKMMMMKITVLKVTSAAFVFPSGKAANPEPCTSRALGAAVEILSFRAELLISLSLWQGFFFSFFFFLPQWDQPWKQQILLRVASSSHPQAQISLDVPPLLRAAAG